MFSLSLAVLFNQLYMYPMYPSAVVLCLPLPLRQTDSYYVLYTFLLNVLKKGCWGGGGVLGYKDIYCIISL